MCNGTATLKTIGECSKCGGHGIIFTRLAYRKFDMVICGHCDGTMVEPPADDDTYSAFYHLFDLGHKFA
jgi:DnaJ-class molecular chaperone